MASGGADKRVVIHRTATGLPAASFPAPGMVSSLAFFSPSGRHGPTKLVAGCFAGSLLFLDVERQVEELRTEIGSQKVDVNTLAVAPSVDAPSSAILAVAGKAPCVSILLVWWCAAEL